MLHSYRKVSKQLYHISELLGTCCHLNAAARVARVPFKEVFKGLNIIIQPKFCFSYSLYRFGLNTFHLLHSQFLNCFLIPSYPLGLYQSARYGSWLLSIIFKRFNHFSLWTFILPFIESIFTSHIPSFEILCILYIVWYFLKISYLLFEF